MTTTSTDRIVAMIRSKGFNPEIVGYDKISVRLPGRRCSTYRVAPDGVWRGLDGVSLDDALYALVAAKLQP